MKASCAAWLVVASASSAFAQDKGGEKKPEPPPPAPAPPPASAPSAPSTPPPALFAGTPQDLAAKHANVSVREIGRSAGNRPLVLVSVLGKDAKESDVEWDALDVAARLAEKPESIPPHCAVRVLVDGNPDATAYAKDGRIRSGNDTPVD